MASEEMAFFLSTAARAVARRCVPPASTHPRVLQENLIEAFDMSSRQRIQPTWAPPPPSDSDSAGAPLAVSSVEPASEPAWSSPESMPVSDVRLSDGSVGRFEACPGRSLRLPRLHEAVPRTLWRGPERKGPVSSTVSSVAQSVRDTALDVTKRDCLRRLEDVASADWTTNRFRDTEMGAWIEGLHRHGVAMLTGLPTEEPALCEFLNSSFGAVRGTVYGRGFSIKAVANPNNLAYSDKGLQLHTDLPFYTFPPEVQFFHCLEAATEGGETVVCDGFAAAETLFQRDPEAFRVLASHPVQFYDLTPEWHLEATHPTLALENTHTPTGGAGGTMPALKRIHFNQRVRDSWRAYDPLSNCPHSTDAALDAFYDALDQFEAIVDDEAHHLEILLKPGEVVVTDNWRVLHSRRSFTGGRRFEGTYVDWDALRAYWRATVSSE